MNSIDLTIYPVKVDDSGKKLKYPIHSTLPDLEAGFTLGIIMPRGQGKDTIISNLLLSPNFLNRQNYDFCFIFSPTIRQDTTGVHLRKYFSNTIYSEYDDNVIKQIIDFQKSHDVKDMPKTIIVLNDSCGFNTPYLDYLCTRSRHYNTSIIISTQKVKDVRPVVRNNLTDVILGRTKNQQELEDIYTEWGALFGSRELFFKKYKYATKDKYSFLFMKLGNPPRMFKNFTEEITPPAEESDDND